MKSYRDLQRVSLGYHDASGCHGSEHTLRVVRLCWVLGDSVDVDMGVLIPAAYLHDIGRPLRNHALESGVLAEKILLDLGYEAERVEKIVYAIKVHSYSGRLEADTIEAQVLRDADTLDAMGAIGVYRAAQYGAENKQGIRDFTQHFHDKLLKLSDRLFTDEARTLGEKRHRFLLEYLEQVELELGV